MTRNPPSTEGRNGWRSRAVGPAVAALVLGALSACGSAGSATTSGAAVEAPASGQLPLTHIHGVGIDPADGTLLLATHDGLFQVGEGGESTRVGPVIDLMGFAVIGPGHFVASGHPGPGVDLPQPVGLIESMDGGRTWKQVSRQGVSDFHALTVSDGGVLGYDGSLWRSSDGKKWQQVPIPAAPAFLSASPDGAQILATTQQGVLRSADGGSSWSKIDGVPLLQVVDWAENGINLVGVDPDGLVWTSADAGATWQQGPRLGSAPQAVDVSGSGDGTRVIVVTTEALLQSKDGARTFDVLLEQ